MHIFEKLKSLHQPAPINRKRPTLEIITEVEDKLEIKLPATYKKFQLEYSDINLPPFEMFTLLKDGGELDFVKNTNDARAYYQLPLNLIPFVEDNGNYFCFDLSSAKEDYKVVYFSHDGLSEETWPNFLVWVEKCWIKEHEK